MTPFIIVKSILIELGECRLAELHSLSYRPIRVHLVPNYHLAGDPLELPEGPLGVPGPHFENQWARDDIE